MKKIKENEIIVYGIVLYIIWSVMEICIYPNIKIENIFCFYFIKNVLIKNLIWTIPSIYLIYKYIEKMHIKPKDLFKYKLDYTKYIPIAILFTIYILTSSYLKYGNIGIVDSFDVAQLIIILFVGIQEELVFRGLFLNSNLNENNKIKYVLINAILFLLIHLPIWINNGVFISNFANLSFIVILVLSVIFSITFIKSKSIIVPTILHSYWDLLIILFIG